MALEEQDSKPAQDGAKNESRNASHGSEAHEDRQADDKKQPDKPRSKRPLIILAIIVLVLAIVAFFFWFAKRNQVSTDDAYTDGNAVTMVPKVSGYVIALYVNDNTHVKKGDLLLRIDPRDYLTAQAQAEAQLLLAKTQLKSAEDAYRIAQVQYPAQLASAQAQQEAAEANLALAESSYARQHQVDRRATTQENIDASTSQRSSSAANVKSAKAQVAIARQVPEQLQQAADAVSERAAQVQQAEAQLAQA